jgi:hypothetical protein
VTHRIIVSPIPQRIRGDVCPEAATIGGAMRDLGRTATSFGNGQQDSQAFATGHREVPP